jgi:hypothetical protein
MATTPGYSLGMAKLLQTLRKLFASKPGEPGAQRPQRSDPQFVGRSSKKEIEQASPERVGELVGHAPERVET